MRYLVRALIVAAVISQPVAYAQDDAKNTVAVIVHKDNPISEMSREELSAYFLKRKTQWPTGASVRPLDLPPSSATRKHFSEKVLGQSVRAVESYWQRLVFSGRATKPQIKAYESLVVRMVLEDPRAIGYVSSELKLDKVKIVQIRP